MKKTLILVIVALMGGMAMANDLVMENRPQVPVDFHNYQIPHLRTDNLPATYDSREHGYDYPVRDQVIGGTCWAFAHTDAMRAGLNTLGCAERGAIATCILTNCHPYRVNHLIGGGNQAMAVSMTANLQGPVLEADFPYSITDSLCPQWSIEDIYAMPLAAAFLPKDDPIAVKKAIMKFGIITGIIYWKSDFYNKATNTYCYKDTVEANHEICLVGWDDNRQAWLMRNSWGPDAHKDGHVWVSYEDVHITKENTCYYKMVPKSAIDKAYTYSESPCIGYESGFPGEPIAGIVRFFAPSPQQITYIGTYTQDKGTEVQFNVYEGKKLVYESKKQTVTYPSFVTFALETPVTVSGEFYVRISFSQGQEAGRLPIETLRYPLYNPSLHAGDQWIERGGMYDEAGEGSIFDADVVAFVYTKDPSATAIWEEEEMPQTPLLINGQVNPEIWEKAEWIHVFDLSGREIGTITAENSYIPTSLKGIYLFQVIGKEGKNYTQKCSLY